MSARNLPAVIESPELASLLQNIRNFPILTSEEERDLAKRWHDNGDKEAAHKLVTSHLRLVAKAAFGMRNYGLPVADLFSEGTIGLMHAVKKFDPDRGFRLATYAIWWIKSAIAAYILDNWSLVPLGTKAAQKKLFFSLSRIKANLGMIEQGDITPEQAALIATETGVPALEIIDMNRRLTGRDMSLNTPIRSSSDDDIETERQDLLVDDSATPEDILADIEEREYRLSLLEIALATLPEREREILVMRRLTDDPMKLEDIGKQLGVSRERVRQLENRAYAKLRVAMDAEMRRRGDTVKLLPDLSGKA